MEIGRFIEGQPCWLELRTSARREALDFYTGLLEWQYEEREGLTTALIRGRAVASIVDKTDDSRPDEWITYIAVASVDDAVERVKEAGGVVLEEAENRPGLGRVALVADSPGKLAAVMGLMEIGDHQGYEVYYKAGAPYWHELYSRNFPGTVKFFEDVYDWKTQNVSDVVGHEYVTLQGEESGPVAGIMNASVVLKDNIPATWRIYWGVANAAAQIDVVGHLGGRAASLPTETNIGAVASVIDPGGARFLIGSGYPVL